MQITAGKFKGRPLISPKGKTTRPTSSKLRETVFNILQGQVENALFLDIFAGTGAMGLEALSRGAAHATFIEKDRDALRCLKENLSTLGMNTGTLISGDFLKGLERLYEGGKQFHIIYADAPYSMTFQNKPVSEVLLHWLDTHSLLKQGGVLFIENDREKTPASLSALKWVNSRRSGKAYLHQWHYLL